MTLKPTMSEAKRTAIINSVQTIGVLAEMILIEHQNELVDSCFKNAIANQKAKRIKQDAQGIIIDLSTNPRVNIRFNEKAHIEDYACELHLVFTFFIGLPIQQVKDVMDNLYKISQEVEA